MRLTRLEAVKRYREKVDTATFVRKRREKAGVERPVNGGKWTNAYFVTKIMSHLRGITRYWRPAVSALTNSSVSRTQALCAICLCVKNRMDPKVKRRLKSAFSADHITPCVPLVEITGISFEDYIEAVEHGVDPITLFKAGIDWNVRVRNMFSETGWQSICNDCHSEKTGIERVIRKEAKKKLEGASPQEIKEIFYQAGRDNAEQIGELKKKARIGVNIPCLNGQTKENQL